MHRKIAFDLKSLPEAVQNDLKARAQKVFDAYEQYKRKFGKLGWLLDNWKCCE